MIFFNYSFMQVYLYLSLIPESLIASMLNPEEFGNYFAVGTNKRSRGQAIFFEVSPNFQSNYFSLDQIGKRCVPHEDGHPRKSSYLSIYRVLENIPLEALGKLYLATADGRVIGLEPEPFKPESKGSLHLYQEFCPVTPRVVSSLNPIEYSQFITDRKQLVSVPRIAFCEMKLERLVEDPHGAWADNLPYPNFQHLRDCLEMVRIKGEKDVKTVIRSMHQDILYRTIKNGFFVGEADRILYYPMPSRERLENEYYEWWRSALASFGE